MPQKVQDQSPEVVAMAEHWPVVAALLGGTVGMRKAGLAYLPKEPREDDADYEFRRETATLFPAFERTLTVMASKPFSKQVVLSDETPPEIVEWMDNCDLQGNNLHAFASQVLRECMGFGLCGILVEYPKVSEDVKTKAQEAAVNARPYLVHIKHSQILGWRAELSALGVITLTQLRLAEKKTVNDGEFGMMDIDCVRVYEPGTYRVYEKIKEDYSLTESGVTTLKVIPFVPFYGRKLGFMQGRTPLLDLAHLNVKHWQHGSDQDDSARFARKRLLVFSGIDSDSEITASSSYAIKLPTGASAQVVQGSAESVSVGRTELQALEEHMIQTGAELMVNRAGAMRTATESMNEAEANKSDLQSIIEQFEDGLDSTLVFVAGWAGLAEGGDVNLFKDFGAGSLSEASAQLIMSMQQGGLITKETAIKEQQRRGLLAANIDAKTELENVEAEGPELGGIGLDDDDGGLPGAPPKEGAPPVIGNPIAPTEPAAPALDISPLTDAILSLVERMDAQLTQTTNAPEPVASAPLDLAALVAAINNRPDPVVNMEAVIDATPIADAVAKAIAAMPRPEAPIINMPAITVEQPSIVINNPPAAPINIGQPAINIAAPTAAKTAVMTKQANGSYVMQVTTNPSE